MSFECESQIGTWRLITALDPDDGTLTTELWRATAPTPDMPLTRLVGAGPVWTAASPWNAARVGLPLYAGTRHWRLVQGLTADPLPPDATPEDVHAYCTALWHDPPAVTAEDLDRDPADTRLRVMVSEPHDPDTMPCRIETTWAPGDATAQCRVWRTDRVPPAEVWTQPLRPDQAGAEHWALMTALAARPQTMPEEWGAICEDATLFSPVAQARFQATAPTDQAYDLYVRSDLADWGPFELETARPVGQPVQVTLRRTDVPPDEAVLWQYAHIPDEPAYQALHEQGRSFDAEWLHHEAAHTLHNSLREFQRPDTVVAQKEALQLFLEAFYRFAPVARIDAATLGTEALGGTCERLTWQRIVRELGPGQARLLCERPPDAQPEDPWSVLVVKAKKGEAATDDQGRPVVTWRTVDKFAPLFQTTVDPGRLDAFLQRVDTAAQALGGHPAWFPRTWPELHPERWAQVVQAAVQGPVIPTPKTATPANPKARWAYGFDDRLGMYFLWTEDAAGTVTGIAKTELPTPIPGTHPPQKTMPHFWVDPTALLREAAAKDLYPTPARRVPTSVQKAWDNTQQRLAAAAAQWEAEARAAMAATPDPSPSRPAGPALH